MLQALQLPNAHTNCRCLSVHKRPPVYPQMQYRARTLASYSCNSMDLFFPTTSIAAPECDFPASLLPWALVERVSDA